MLKLAIVGVVSIALSCGGLVGYQWYQSQPKKTDDAAKTERMEEVKTDFISIAVFKDGKVRGYITFRIKMLLKDTDRMVEAGYLVADTIHRKLELFSVLFNGNFKPKDAKIIEEPLRIALSSKLGEGELGGLTLTDVAFDKRAN